MNKPPSSTRGGLSRHGATMPQRARTAQSPSRPARVGGSKAAATASLAASQTAKYLPRTILSPKWKDRGNHLARTHALDEAGQRLQRAQEALDAAEADAAIIDLARVYTAKLQHRHEILSSMTQADRLWYLTQMRAVSPARGGRPPLAASDVAAAVTGLDAPDTPPQVPPQTPARTAPVLQRTPSTREPLSGVPVLTPEPSPLPVLTRQVSARGGKDESPRGKATAAATGSSVSPVTDSRRSVRVSSAFADAFAAAHAVSSRPSSMALPEGVGSAAFSGRDAAQAAMLLARNRLASHDDSTAALLFGSDGAGGSTDPAVLRARLEALSSIDAAAKEASRGRRRTDVLHFRPAGGRAQLGSQGSVILPEEGSFADPLPSPGAGGVNGSVVLEELSASTPTPFPLAGPSSAPTSRSSSAAPRASQPSFTARDATYLGLTPSAPPAAASGAAASAPSAAAAAGEEEEDAGLTRTVKGKPATEVAPVAAPSPAAAPAPTSTITIDATPAPPPSRGRRGSSVVPLLDMPGTKPTTAEAAAALELPSQDLSAEVAQRLASRSGRPASTTLAPSVAALLSGRARSSSAARSSLPSAAAGGPEPSGSLSGGPSLVGPSGSVAGGGGSGPGSEGVTPMASLSSVPRSVKEAPKAVVFRGKQVIIPVISSDLSSDDGGGFDDDFEGLSD